MLESKESIASVVREAYRQRVKNKVDAITPLFAEQGRIEVAGVPMAAVVAGRSAEPEDVRMTLSAMVATWSWLEVTPLALLIDGDRAAAHNRVRLRFEPTGEEVETEILDLFTIKAGRIMHLVEFVDTALLARLAAAAASRQR